MAKLNVLDRNRFYKLLRFGLYMCIIFAIFFYIDTKKFWWPQLIGGFVFGIIFGIFEEVTSSRKFSSLRLSLQYLYRILGFLLISSVIVFLPLLFHKSPDEFSMSLILEYLSDRRISNIFLSASLVFFTVSTYFQIEKLVGKNMLSNYLRGKYRKPKKEIRVFLFMDLKSSTTLSEKLGNETYYSFLNDAIYDMSRSIMETKAEIYQYVGDEIVFTWTLDKGITNNNCLRLYEKISEKLDSRKAYYLKNYGYQPQFKAAMHAGIVLAAEIGHIKKDIVYSGDVLNVTSRMESLCNKYQADILISKSLFNLLERKHEIIYEDLGQMTLKGKDEKLELIKIHPSDSSFTKERNELKKALKVN